MPAGTRLLLLLFYFLYSMRMYASEEHNVYLRPLARRLVLIVVAAPEARPFFDSRHPGGVGGRIRDLRA